VSKSKQRGTAFETLVLQQFKEHYPSAIRSPLSGAADRGDIYIFEENRYAIECKNVARMDLSGWVGEAEVEAANAGKQVGVVVHKRKGKGQPAEQYVTMTLGSFLTLVAPKED
jgi:Holliday junction resolvase